MIQALIFDFDGLILDTETPIFQSWQEIFRQHGCELTLETWADIIGRPPDFWNPVGHLQRCLDRPVDGEALVAAQRRREEALIAGQPVLPGVLDYLDEASRLGLRIGVASSSPRAWVLGHLSRLGLAARFEVIMTSDDVAQAKPSPDLYLAAVEALEVLPDQAVAFEDSPNGVLAAKRAGIYCVAVPNLLTRRLSLDHADMVIPSLAAWPLEALLAKVRSNMAGS